MTAAVYSKGLTWRTLLALIFGAFIIQPVTIYSMLIMNVPLPIQGWIIILLFTEFARFMGSPFTKQEIFILLSFQSMAIIYGIWFLNPVKNAYMAFSLPAQALGISKHVPSWWVPSEKVLLELRSSRLVFFDPSWLIPISIMLLDALFWLLTDISMGYFCYGLFVKVEKLKFPAASAQVDTITTLAERERLKIRVLMTSALGGVMYGLLFSFLPFFIGPFLGGRLVEYAALPPLAIDFTPLLANILQGAGFAVTSYAVPYVLGFLLPLSVAISQFLGAFSFYFLGTHLITRLNLWPSESPYSPSWPISTLVDRAQLYFFISISIGLSIAATFLPLFLHPRSLTGAFSALKRMGQRSSSGDYPAAERIPPLLLLLLMFFGATLGSSLLNYFLVPSFPLPLLILFISGGSFFVSFLSAGAAGVTTGGLTMPYQKELIIYHSGYKGKDLWFAPITMYYGGAIVAQSFFQAEICRVSTIEYAKTYIIVTILSLLSGFISVSIFWSVAPIPSGAYPASIFRWPVDALNWARTQEWIWSGYLFRTSLILYSLLAGSVVYAVTDFVFHLPHFLISFIAGGLGTVGVGTLTVLPTQAFEYSLAMLIGSIVAQKVIKPRFGEVFDKIRGVVVIGFTLGAGFIDILIFAVILLLKSMWLLPY